MPSIPIGEPLRPSEIKAAIYGGRRGFGKGLRFDQRVLLAGWSLKPSIGLVAKDINKLGLEIDNFRKPLIESIRLVMTASIRKNFTSEGRPERWEELHPYTVRIRGSDHPILRRTGALERAASSFGIWTFTNTSASVQHLPTAVWYGAIHQGGYGSMWDTARRELGRQASERDIKVRALQLFMGARPPSKQSKFIIPQREFILFQLEDEEAIQDIFIEWMEGLARDVGRSWNYR